MALQRTVKSDTFFYCDLTDIDFKYVQQEQIRMRVGLNHDNCFDTSRKRKRVSVFLASVSAFALTLSDKLLFDGLCLAARLDLRTSDTSVVPSLQLLILTEQLSASSHYGRRVSK